MMKTGHPVLRYQSQMIVRDIVFFDDSTDYVDTLMYRRFFI